MTTMHRSALFGFALISFLFFEISPIRTASAQETRNPEAHAQSQSGPPQGGDHPDQRKDNENAPIPPEKPSVTRHEMNLGGRTLHYTATAGTLIIRDEEDKPYGSMFYVAYTLDGAEARTRPVSFLYNGGPGSASLWLHMGSFSPVRITTDSPNAPPVLPSSWSPTTAPSSTRPTWSSWMRRLPVTHAP